MERHKHDWKKHKRHAGIARCACGQWQVRATVTTATGRRVDRLLTLEGSEGAAVDARALLIEELRESNGSPSRPGTSRSAGPKTWSDCAERWLEVRARGVTTETARVYTSILSRFCAHLGHLAPDELTRRDLEGYALGMRGSKFAPRTVSQHFRTILAMVRDVCADLDLRDPSVRLRLSGQAPEPAGRALAEVELRRVLEAAAAVGGSKGALVELLALTGLRPSEALRIRWEDLDLEAGQLRIRESKTATGRRVVPLASRLVETLRALPRTGDLVWARSTWWTRAAWGRVASEAGVQAQLYDLRRTFVTLLRRGDVDQATRLALVGHSDARTNLIYDRSSAEDRRRALDRVLDLVQPVRSGVGRDCGTENERTALDAVGEGT